MYMDVRMTDFNVDSGRNSTWRLIKHGVECIQKYDDVTLPYVLYCFKSVASTVVLQLFYNGAHISTMWLFLDLKIIGEHKITSLF